MRASLSRTGRGKGRSRNRVTSAARSGPRTAPAPRDWPAPRVFLTGRPWTMSRTASSVILPDLVRGMSATATILAGTWRGLAPVRISVLIALDQRRRRASTPSLSRTNSTTRTSSSQSWPMASASITSGICSTWAIDLGGADAHAAGIERGVGAAVDDDAAMLGPFGEVAVAPDAGEALEIGGAVLRAVGVVPERRSASRGTAWCRPARPCRRARGLPSSSQTSTAMPRPGPGSRRARPARSGSPSTKQETMSVPPEIEARCMSGLMRVVDVVEALRRQRRAGRGDQPQTRRGRGSRPAEPGLLAARRCTSPRCRRASPARSAA